MLEQTLKCAGHDVALAADGREGVENLCLRQADLVLTDIYMPNQEGLETIREVRTRFPQIPIVAMSGRETAVTMLAIAQKLGAVRTLQKPFTTEELLKLVAAVASKTG